MVSKKAGVMSFLDNLSKPPAAADGRIPVSMLQVSALAPDPERAQPRTEFDQEALENLAASIRVAGIIQAITIRPSGHDAPAYYIVDGERRWRAAQLAGLDEVPVFLRLDVNDDASFQFALQVMANAQSNHLSDYDMARAIKRIIDDKNTRHGIKSKIAEMANLTRAQVSRLLSMLDPDVEPLAREGLLRSVNAVVAFKALDDESRVAVVEQARAKGEPLTFSELQAAKVLPAPAGDTTADSSPDSGQESGAADGDQARLPPSSVSPTGSDLDSDSAAPPATGSAGSSTAPPRSTTSTSNTSSKDKVVKIKLTGEKVESLLRFLVDKSTDKLDVSLPRDLAIAVLENMGIELPDDPDAFAVRIRDFLE